MTIRCRRPVILSLVLPALLAACSVRGLGAESATRLQPSLTAFTDRVRMSREQLPLIIKAAEAAAERSIAHPGALINVPYQEQRSFAEDIVNRSGGLSNALPVWDHRNELTPHDILLFSVRSWDTDGRKNMQVVSNYKARGWMVVLFASKVGAPAELEVDYLIDNGATSAGEDQAPVNAITNVYHGWLWCVEFTAALTRRGKHPSILKSMVVDEGGEHNNVYQKPENRKKLWDIDGAVPQGQLAELYMKRVQQLLDELAAEPTQSQINEVADILADRMAAGKTVGLAAATHFNMSEIFLNTKCPWKPFNVVWRAETAFKENLKEGDLLFWMHFTGMSSPLEDYGTFIREAKVDFVTCFATDPNPDNNAPDALAHIEQRWEIGDAEVPIPFPPGRMAPVSGINQGLLFRMLDDAVAVRLDRAAPE